MFKNLKLAIDEVLRLKASMDNIVDVGTRLLTALSTNRVQLFPCGIILYGERAWDNEREPFLCTSAQLLPSATKYSWSFSPDTNVRNVQFIAYGPCGIVQLKVANTDLNIWQSNITGGPVAVYRPIIHPAHLISVAIQTWKW